jgi:hypothetical protein
MSTSDENIRVVMPAEAGIQSGVRERKKQRLDSACAGMTE